VHVEPRERAARCVDGNGETPDLPDDGRLGDVDNRALGPSRSDPCAGRGEHGERDDYRNDSHNA